MIGAYNAYTQSNYSKMFSYETTNLSYIVVSLRLCISTIFLTGLERWFNRHQLIIITVLFFYKKINYRGFGLLMSW